MEWVVTTAKSVEDAKEAALDELGVDEADAEFEVLEEPRQGLFGRQRGEARVRARVRPTSPRPKVERRGRTKKKSADEESNTRSPGVSANEEGISPGAGHSVIVPSGIVPSEIGADEVGATADRAPRGRSRKALAPEVAAAVAAAAEETVAETSSDAEPVKRPRRAPAARSKPTNGRNGDSGGRSPVSATRNGGASVPEENLSMDEQGRIAEQFIVGLLERFQAPAQTATRTVDDDTVEIDVTGAELGLLIGPKGQTLQAVQELTRTVVQRKSVARAGRIHVDISGYRSKRREALERFTTQVTGDVIASGVQRVLEPMSAADRKVVHDTANGIAGVRTVSEGEDPRRRVVIIPDAITDAGAGDS